MAPPLLAQLSNSFVIKLLNHLCIVGSQQHATWEHYAAYLWMRKRSLWDAKIW
jgi:hypothetical protein